MKVMISNVKENGYDFNNQVWKVIIISALTIFTGLAIGYFVGLTIQQSILIMVPVFVMTGVAIYYAYKAESWSIFLREFILCSIPFTSIFYMVVQIPIAAIFYKELNVYNYTAVVWALTSGILSCIRGLALNDSKKGALINAFIMFCAAIFFAFM